MAQHDYDIANDTGANVRADINNVLDAIATNNNGSSAPSTTFAHQFFANNTTGNMQLRNAGNSAFLDIFTLTGGPAFAVDGTINSLNIGKGTNDVNGNTCFGENALDAAVSGENNTAIGKNTLTANTSGEANTAIGSNVLKANTTGSRNTGLGINSFIKNEDGNDNVALGNAALKENTSGTTNCAVGNFALDANTTGTRNVAVGHNACSAQTTATDCVGVGVASLFVNETGSSNTALGRKALTANTTGSRNTALGQSCLDVVTTADDNTGVGNNALGATSGAQNTAVGSAAGDLISTGSNNIILGYNADPSAADANNEVVLGNSSISVLRCQVNSISALSDARDKTNIIDLPVGLDFLNTLQPRQFEWKTREGVASVDGTVRAGFIAQELQEAQKECDYLNLVFSNNPDKLEATYGNLIPVLVKAVQELSAKVTALEVG